MGRTFEPGIYRAKVTTWGLTKAGTGNTQFALRFTPTAVKGADGEWYECPQFERTVFRAITANTIDYFVADLRGLGYDRDSFDALDPNAPDAFDFAAREIEVRLEYEEYQGKDRERWSLNRGPSELKPVERKEVSQLNAAFGARLKASRPGNGKPAAKPQPRPAQRPAQPKTTEEQAEEVF